MWTAKDETWLRMKALKNLLQHVQVRLDVETWQKVWQCARQLRGAMENAHSLQDWSRALELLTRMLQVLQLQEPVVQRSKRLRRRVRRLSGDGPMSLPWKTHGYTLEVGCEPGAEGGRSPSAQAEPAESSRVPQSSPLTQAGPVAQAQESAEDASPLRLPPTRLLTQAEPASEPTTSAPSTEKASHLERFPTIEAPSAVPCGAVFRVMVQVLEQNVTGALQGLCLDAEQELTIGVQLEVADASVLRVLGQASAQLLLPPQGNSVGLFFELQGLKPTQAHFEVRFLQTGLVRGRVSWTLDITDAPPAASAPAAAASGTPRRSASWPTSVRSAAAGFTPFLPAAMLLTVLERQDSEKSTELYVVLNQQSYVQTLPEKFREQLQQLCLDLKEEIRSEDDQTRELRLQSLGLRLATILLPREVKAALLQAPAGTPLHIQSDELWIPWELLRLGTFQAGVYLGEHFAVSRSLKSGPHRLDLHRGPSVLVAVPSDLDPEAERAALAQISGQTPESLSRPRETMMRMREGKSIAFMHFVCHGKTQESELMGGRLLLEDKLPLSAADIPGLEVVGEPAPLKGSLVFVNACQAGVPTLNLGGFGSFADAFLLAGASAVVLPSWSVGDRSAVRMAVAFYQALDQGLLPAEALRQARLTTRTDGSSYSHAYALYAQPDARLTP